MEPRGLRNNNPLNIVRGVSQWEGLKKEETDSRFCEFETPEYGWRAAFVLLTRTYYHAYRLYTIRKIIERWAPPNENQTEDYITAVAEAMDYDPDKPLGLPSYAPFRWMALALAMAYIENGTRKIDTMPLFKGWEMAKVGSD